MVNLLVCLKRVIIGCSFLIMFIVVWWFFMSSCIIAPRSFAWVVCSIGVLFMCSVVVLCVFFGWKMVYCVFVGFGTRSLRWKYLMSWVSSVCAICCSACGVSAVMISVVSSAYVYTFELFVWVMVLMMLFM